ncbi:hypothetical protein MycrhDRAFT_1412 [Mycolicibacterium rhodesiae JS60]|nr:hypothetical protein MycrhDRAFT_1412 [Mycolicibacterium rhodesiae JS60]
MWETTSQHCYLCGRFLEESTSKVLQVTNCRCPNVDCANHPVRPAGYYDDTED